ncbi:hypothetical protein [Streptomyces sp. NPDC017448]|uniref:hypothetical protein n=1 Tax=Streptomyces sp. NPDC017448 TaxID=3364996 RepID=UPI00378BD87A
MTARQLFGALFAVLKEQPEVADLPAVVMEDGHLANVVRVDVSSLDGGMLLLDSRDYDRERPASASVLPLRPGPEGL